MNSILRHGAVILLVVAILIFVVSLVVGLSTASNVPDQFAATPCTGRTLMLGVLANALSNSVWPFGLACIVDRLDRDWGTRK